MFCVAGQRFLVHRRLLAWHRLAACALFCTAKLWYMILHDNRMRGLALTDGPFMYVIRCIVVSSVFALVFHGDRMIFDKRAEQKRHGRTTNVYPR